MTKKILEEIRTKFEAALQAKTGWGKNEVMCLYNAIIIDVLADNIKED